MPKLLFISDLHLSPGHPAITRMLLEFLDTEAPTADALYILGDLFDSWIGDDDDSQPANQVREALGSLSNQIPVYFQPGNRDFLLGKQFAGQTGINLLPDESVIDIGGQRILLMHGDLLCTDDKDYQQARSTLRNPQFIADFLARSLQERAQIAAHYRKLSGEAIATKAADIMDVNQHTVVSYMTRHQANTLIHGHTHRPAEHSFEIAGETCQRQVLAAWSEQSAPILQLDYSAEKPGMVISRYAAGTTNKSGVTG